VPKTQTYNNTPLHNRDDFPNVLIVVNEPETTRLMLEIMAYKAIRGHLANDAKAALEFLEKNSCDLVFTSSQIKQKNNDTINPQSAIDLLVKITSRYPEMPVIMIAKDSMQETANPTDITQTAVTAMRLGCSDFLTKPLQKENIENILDTFLPSHNVSTADMAMEDTHYLYKIVGQSQKILQSIETAKKIAKTSAPVLINGPSGTGKELFSYLIHHNSKRAQQPYVRVNCAALSDSLLESELFGHEKGAFTGAYNKRQGRFEMAHGGTLLLDEITETPLSFQAKLLRVLEQQDFERVGGNENVKVDVRVISTTNKDLLNEVRQGNFRRDLYYRISGIRLMICPLNERVEDIQHLVWHFVNLYAREAQRKIAKLDPIMIDIFANYHWPGNVRQLRNVVRTSLILGTGETLSLADVSWLLDETIKTPNTVEYTNNQPISDCTQNTKIQNPGDHSLLAGIPLAQIERKAILETLRTTAGNQTKAAKVLGISDRTLRDKIRRYRQQGELQLAK
jgi:two-component system response regulator AtoC